MAKGDPTTSTSGIGYFPSLYQSVLGKTAEDYDKIMRQYEDLASSVKRSTSPTQFSYSPISPSFVQYEPGPSYDYLRDFITTGGYGEGDIAAIRARSIAPIRSIYASAQRELARRKALQGGYSPNYGALLAKMARESSNIIGDKTTDINAAIAEMVQRGKLAGATALAPLEAQEAARRSNITATNAEIANRIASENAERELRAAELNRSSQLDEFSKILEGIKGQQSLYGTTPALASTFGNQVLQAANLVSDFPPITRDINTGAVISGPTSSLGRQRQPLLGAAGTYPHNISGGISRPRVF